MAYAMGRMPYIWGDDAEEFKPERWIKDGTFQTESPFKFVAFHVRIIVISFICLIFHALELYNFRIL